MSNHRSFAARPARGTPAVMNEHWGSYLALAMPHDGLWRPRSEVVDLTRWFALSDGCDLGNEAHRLEGRRSTRKIADCIKRLGRNGLVERQGLEDKQIIRWSEFDPVDVVRPVLPGWVARRVLDDPPPRVRTIRDPLFDEILQTWRERPRAIQRHWKVPDSR